jgi:hypothetical protein
MADWLYSTYDLEWLGINILDAASDLTVTQERGKMVHSYLAGTATQIMEHQMALVQESRQAWLLKEEQKLLQEVFVTKIDALYNLHATRGVVNPMIGETVRRHTIETLRSKRSLTNMQQNVYTRKTNYASSTESNR